jgi:crotonobetainyl-CoA:carnitine CoA-transferase CaiB-like acyl-CoA transferase
MGCAGGLLSPIVPICDNVVAWLGTTGILAAMRRRAVEGGSYRVMISLTRVVLWLLSLGIFDKASRRPPPAPPTSTQT